ncbi:hypothetical protein ACH5RR_033048 [Cinchona calisaya]|uniref:RNase H type-1 domain-containing protein n=1 Tax=Cinchona calisaya TaxID=153742 RepID=A0ABD2YJU7_9GENT
MRGSLREKKEMLSRLEGYALNFLQEYRNRNGRLEGHINVAIKKWTQPTRDLLKINVNGAYSENGAGIGLVFRGYQGEIQVKMVDRAPGAIDAEYTESLAFVMGLKFAKDFGISHCILEGDAVNVVNRINSKKPDLSVSGSVMEGIRNMLSEFTMVNLTYVKRQCNSTAHLAAQLSLAANGSQFVNFPKNVMVVAEADLN